MEKLAEDNIGDSWWEFKKPLFKYQYWKGSVLL